MNTFLPGFPLTTMEEARIFYEKQFVSKFNQQDAYHYAICLKQDNYPVGHVMKKLGMEYQYSYEEQWQIKDICVTFRMY